METTRHDVVITGAGPTGLALAAELKRLGVEPFVVDRQAEGANTSRAAVVHARTLEVLEPMGATRDLLQNGLIVKTFRIRDRDKVLATVDFGELKTAYPFTLLCPQNRTEAILLGRLEAMGGGVRRPCELTSIQPLDGEVELQFRNGDGFETVHTKWLVGCDGMHSKVREQASIPFEGGAYEEAFVLADVEMEWPFQREEVSLFFSEKGLALVAPLPDEHFRIVATVTKAMPEPSVEDFQAILDERGPKEKRATIKRMSWSSRFHIHHRMAKKMRAGRILLAGDAAHVHSPAGGQGMNTGIQDAVSLAQALHSAITTGNETALDEWEQKRLRIARSVVSATDRMTRFANTSSRAGQMLRNAAVEFTGHIPLVRHAMAQKLSELDNR